ncbi:UNVERIFIED_CONTAM: magnesium transporter [Campylobacter lari]
MLSIGSAQTINLLSVLLSLSALIPIINNATNNSALQANISVSRAIALNEIDKKDYKKVILKEFIVSLLVAFILVLLNISRLGIYFTALNEALLSKNDNVKMYYLYIIIGSSLALFIAIILSNFLGVIIPISLTKMKKDPSSVSVLLINVLTDITTSFILFGITYGLFTLI